MDEANSLTAIFVVTSIIPSVGYATHSMTGLFIGFGVAMIIQFALLGLFIKYVAKNNKGPIASFLDIYDILLMGVGTGAISLAYVMYESTKDIAMLATGLVVGAAMSLITEGIAIKTADNMFSTI